MTRRCLRCWGLSSFKVTVLLCLVLLRPLPAPAQSFDMTWLSGLFGSPVSWFIWTDIEHDGQTELVVYLQTSQSFHVVKRNPKPLTGLVVAYSPTVCVDMAWFPQLHPSTQLATMAVEEFDGKRHLILYEHQPNGGLRIQLVDFTKMLSGHC